MKLGRMAMQVPIMTVVAADISDLEYLKTPQLPLVLGHMRINTIVFEPARNTVIEDSLSLLKRKHSHVGAGANVDRQQRTNRNAVTARA